MNLKQIHQQNLRTYVTLWSKFDDEDAKSRGFNDPMVFRKALLVP